MNKFRRVIDGGGRQPKRYVLVGKYGATQFLYLEATDGRSKPVAFDIGYHSPRPMYSGQTPISHECPYVDGGICYYDGSTLYADEPLEILMNLGEEDLWNFLEREYNKLFSDQINKEE